MLLWTLCNISPLLWRHNGRGSVSNYQPHDYLLNRLFRRRSKKTSKLRVTGLFARNSPVNSPHKWPVTRKMFPFEDVIMARLLENNERNFWEQVLTKIYCFLQKRKFHRRMCTNYRWFYSCVLPLAHSYEQDYVSSVLDINSLRTSWK